MGVYFGIVDGRSGNYDIVKGHPFDGRYVVFVRFLSDLSDNSFMLQNPVADEK